jgi:hypothetical protein
VVADSVIGHNVARCFKRNYLTTNPWGWLLALIKLVAQRYLASALPEIASFYFFVILAKAGIHVFSGLQGDGFPPSRE